MSARGSSLVIGQCQDQIEKLNDVIQTSMQSGITVAEDLLESGQKYAQHINEIEKTMLDFAQLSGDVEQLKMAMSAVEDVVSTPMDEQEPPDLTKIFQTKCAHLKRKSEFKPESHAAVIEFRKRIQEVDSESDSEAEAMNDGDDEDIVLGHVKKSLYCPITKKFLDDPVTSTRCRHSYSRAAIMEHIKKRSKSKCPVCNSLLKECDLEKDGKLERQVRKEKKKQTRKNSATKHAVVKL